MRVVESREICIDESRPLPKNTNLEDQYKSRFKSYEIY